MKQLPTNHSIEAIPMKAEEWDSRPSQRYHPQRIILARVFLFGDYGTTRGERGGGFAELMAVGDSRRECWGARITLDERTIGRGIFCSLSHSACFSGASFTKRSDFEMHSFFACPTQIAFGGCGAGSVSVSSRIRRHSRFMAM